MVEKLTIENVDRLMNEYNKQFENTVLPVLSRMHCESIEVFCRKVGVTRKCLFVDWYHEFMREVDEDILLKLLYAHV